jgi:hypothetical protein
MATPGQPASGERPSDADVSDVTPPADTRAGESPQREAGSTQPAPVDRTVEPPPPAEPREVAPLRPPSPAEPSVPEPPSSPGAHDVDDL